MTGCPATAPGRARRGSEDASGAGASSSRKRSSATGSRASSSARTRSSSLTIASEPWIDVHGAAEHLACKRRRIYDLVEQGRIPHHRDGSRLLFRRSELDASLASDP
jgi:excisionase family DNA binding protein